jgi:hypothetical protein
VNAHPWGEVLAELHLCSGPPVHGFTFVCPSQADNKTTWACTGGQHVAPGQWIRCTCDCHVFTSGSYRAYLPDATHGVRYPFKPATLGDRL